MRTANATLALLRQVALDEKATTTRRLAAIDSLAAMGNFYIHKRTKHLLTSYVEPTVRGRLFLTKALRRLLKARKFCHEGTRPAVNTRLLFLRGVELGSGLWRLTPSDGGAKPTVKSIDPTVARLERLLAEHK